MSITTYNQLCSTIADFLNRQDLTAQIPTFIQMAEAAVNSDERFRVMPAVTRSHALIDGSQTDQWGQYFLPVPDDYLAMQNFRILDLPPPARIDLVTQTQLDDLRQIYRSGPPQYYAISGETMELLPAPPQGQSYTVQMVYYAKVPPLSTDNQSNWLLRLNPNVYLYGSLLHSAPYLKDDERIVVWKAFYEQAAEQINAADGLAQFSGSTMKMRTRKRYR
ncbi:phage adaptor protein [Burkholderia multivorans]|uniref:phage adaptor protein n=1 Tax=Burkholderia multivorans TaxID=87883 RepID=UPI001C254643|nr:hypothetical protein [Burkholderia multivorans]MBU9552827.1 hypothetical protein [Burkholderia multivorans]